jgi:hypothetical protein
MQLSEFDLRGSIFPDYSFRCYSLIMLYILTNPPTESVLHCYMKHAGDDYAYKY